MFSALFEMIIMMYSFIVLELKRRKWACSTKFRIKPEEKWALQFLIAVLSRRGAVASSLTSISPATFIDELELLAYQIMLLIGFCL